MSKQLHTRLPKEFVESVLEAFNDHRIAEEKACELLGIRRAQLYKLRRRWLQCVVGKKPFTLYCRSESAFHRLPEQVEEWLHEELSFIQQKAQIYRGRFNFAVLAEEAQKVFGCRFHRETIRYFALRHGYYHARPEEKHKLYVRFETPGPGFLFQHDTSKHLWVPALGGYQYLILTKDDYSRLFVGAKLVEREGSFEHLEVARKTVERYGRPLAYYVDQHKIFRFVEHHGVHVRYVLGQDEGQIQLDRSINLDLIFSLHYERKVRKDGSFSFRGKQYKLKQCAGKWVTVCLIPHNKILVAWNGKKVGDFPL